MRKHPNTNSVACANAAQLRLTGVDLAAVSAPSDGDGVPIDLLSSIQFGFNPPMTPAAVEEKLLSMLLHGGTGGKRMKTVRQH